MSYLDKLIDDWPLEGSSSLELFLDAQTLLRESRNDEIVWSRSRACEAVLEFCALKHFHFDTAQEPLEQLIDESIRMGIDFYYGDWWHKENVLKWCHARGFAEDSLEWKGEPFRCALLADPSKLEPWRSTLSALMLLCTLSGKKDERAKICDWFGPDPLPEYSGLYWETEATTIVLASHLRSKPMLAVNKLIDKITKGKRPYAHARMRLIESCFEKNQDAFSAALVESLDLFYKSWKKKEPRTMSCMVAVDESTIVAVAQANGMTLPKLTEKQQWALMTPASIGLESSQPT